MTIEQAVGWAGMVLISAAAVPQTIKVWRQGHADGLAWSYVIFLWLGFVCMLLYTPSTKPALRVSYGIQIALFTIMILRKRFPRKTV